MDRRQRWALGAPLLIVAAYALFADTVWLGGWGGTIDRITGTTVLTGPVLASVAAGLQLGAARVRPISDTTVRGWWVPYRSAFEAWSLGCATYVVTVPVAAGCTLSVPHGGAAQWWALAAGPLVLGLASLFGAAACYLLPSRVTVVAAGPVLFLLGALGPAPLPEVLRFGPGGDLAGLEFVPSVYLARFGAVAALCLCLAAAMGPWRQRRRRLALPALAAAAGVVALGAGAGVLATGTGVGDNRLRGSGERASACAEGTPTVCVAPSHRRYLEDVRRSVDAAAPVLLSAGLDLPERYAERFGYSEVPEGSGSFHVDEGAAELSFRDSVLLLARPADCPQWSSPSGPPYAAWDAEQLIAEWAVARHGGAPAAFNPDMEKWLPHIDEAATTDWVVHTFELLKSCRFHRIAMPWE